MKLSVKGENCFQWVGVRHLNSCGGMKFDPVEKAVKGFLVSLAQPFAKSFPSFTLCLQEINKRNASPTYGSSKINHDLHQRWRYEKWEPLKAE